ncbi:MAG TPA: hypothetical protein VG892_05305 [Terriglobales bacterium]|jgi:hypothetical protein|nr:hypothetical protein [Terriglobales bacterium]
MARRANAVLNAIYLVVGVLQIAVALWALRLLPGIAAVLMVVGGLLCILAGIER